LLQLCCILLVDYTQYGTTQVPTKPSWSAHLTARAVLHLCTQLLKIAECAILEESWSNGCIPNIRSSILPFTRTNGFQYTSENTLQPTSPCRPAAPAVPDVRLRCTSRAGCEIWAVKHPHLQQLTSYHNTFTQTMCGINLRHCRMHKISTGSILERLDIRPIDKIFYTRQLRFLHHGPVWAHVPSTLILNGQITRNDNDSWTYDHHIVDLGKHPRTKWASHKRVWRKD
jgi:hypothetical protein